MNTQIAQHPDRLRGLAFSEPLETEFRAQHARASAGVAGPAALLAAAMVGFWALLDYKLRLGGIAQSMIWIKLGLLVPALAAILVIHAAGLSGRTAIRVSTISALLVAAGIAALMFVTPGPELQSVILAAHVATVFLYLLSGQRLLNALASSIPLMIVLQWASAEAGMPATEAAMNGVFLFMTNAVCAVAVYRFEHVARTTFLEREVTAILNGNDAATGIPNRLSLARRHHLIARQGARERRPIACLVAEVAGFDRHTASRGEQAAASDLRRIAHAILHSVRRPLDLAARLEDARFGVLLYDVTAEHLPHVMQLIRENVALLDIERTDKHGPSVLSLTVGAALAGPDSARDLQTLMTVAELALEEAREPENQGIAVRAVAPAHGGEAVTTGPWPQVEEQSAH